MYILVVKFLFVVINSWCWFCICCNSGGYTFTPSTVMITNLTSTFDTLTYCFSNKEWRKKHNISKYFGVSAILHCFSGGNFTIFFLISLVIFTFKLIFRRIFFCEISDFFGSFILYFRLKFCHDFHIFRFLFSLLNWRNFLWNFRNF